MDSKNLFKFMKKDDKLVIPITKEEKDILVKLFPKQKFPRTMKQDSKRHHYFCIESIEFMRPISHSNNLAAEFCREYDKQQALRAARRKSRGGR